MKTLSKHVFSKAQFYLGRRVRRCLGYCGQEFISDGPENRVCEACKGRQAGVLFEVNKVWSGRSVNVERNE